MAGRNVEIKLQGRDAGASAMFNSAAGSLVSLENKAKSASSSVVSSLANIGLAINTIKMGFNFIISSVEGLINAASKQEQAERLLFMQLQGTKNQRYEQLAQLKQYAGSLQDLTKFGDETILMVMRQLYMFGLNNEQVKKATSLTLDLAESTGMEASHAAVIMARALGGDTEMLRRYGIKIDENIGKTKNFDLIMQALQKTIGGTAQEMAKSGIGGYVQLKNVIDDLIESVSKLILDTLGASGVFDTLKMAIKSATEWIAINKDYFIEWGVKIREFVSDGSLYAWIISIKDGLISLIQVLLEVIPLVLKLGGALAGAKAGATIGAAVGSVVPGIGTALGAAIGGITGGVAGYAAGSFASDKLGVERLKELSPTFEKMKSGKSFEELQAQYKQNIIIKTEPIKIESIIKFDNKDAAINEMSNAVNQNITNAQISLQEKLNKNISGIINKNNQTYQANIIQAMVG